MKVRFFLLARVFATSAGATPVASVHLIVPIPGGAPDIAARVLD